MKLFLSAVVLTTAVLMTGCRSSGFQEGKVPKSLVDVPDMEGVQSSGNADGIVVTALRMYFLTHGYAEKSPVLFAEGIPESLKRQLVRNRILIASGNDRFDFRLTHESGKLILRSPDGRILWQKTFSGSSEK